MHLRRNESLQVHNTLALPSRAAALVEVTGEEELRQALTWAARTGLPPIPLGEGSNVVLAEDLEALVLRLVNRGIERIDEDESTVVLRVAAGENWHQLVCWTLGQRLYGLENLALIPGAVGAAPIQNIGAYGVELCSFVEAVHGVELERGEGFSLAAQDCAFGYRDSVFKQRLRDRVVITAVDLRLSLRQAPRVDYPSLAAQLAERGIAAPGAQDVFDAVVAVRRERLPDPAVEPNAGSFFKNPVVDATTASTLAREWPDLPQYEQPGGGSKLPAAWLIEKCGWKGRCEGGAAVHRQHALVLVNRGGGRAEDIMRLARQIQESVTGRFGIDLEIEPRVYGECGD